MNTINISTTANSYGDIYALINAFQGYEIPLYPIDLYENGYALMDRELLGEGIIQNVDFKGKQTILVPHTKLIYGDDFAYLYDNKLIVINDTYISSL